MAAMGAGEQSIQRQVFEVRRPSQRTAWALWIVVSVIGGVLAALAAWQIRTFFIRGPAFISQDARYVGTVVEALILGGAQWLVLRRYRLAVDWWVPVLVAANLLNVIVVIPSVLRLHDGAGVISPATAMIGGASALAAAGLVVGTCQALILRGSAGNVAWAWVPATIIGWCRNHSRLGPTVWPSVRRVPQRADRHRYAAHGGQPGARPAPPPPLKSARSPRRQAAVASRPYSYGRT
jgi:hypothetical protein